MRKGKGFTLLELIFTVSILSLLIGLIAPNFKSFIAAIRVDNEITTLHRFLTYARNIAINKQVSVVVCPLNKSNKCTEDWHKELSIFTDLDFDETFEPKQKELLLRVKPEIKLGDKLEYGLRRKRVAFGPNGRTIGWGSNGTFRYCPFEFKTLSRGIIVSVSGRSYISSDYNNDGYDENRRRKKITCR